MTVELLRQVFEYIATNVSGIDSFFAGDLYDRSSNNVDTYPMLWLALPIRIEYKNDTKVYSIDWYVMDREENTDNFTQRFKLLSKCEQLGEYVMSMLDNLYSCGLVVQSNGVADTFDEFTQDNLLGLHYTTTIETAITTDCNNVIKDANVCSVINSWYGKGNEDVT